MRRLYLAILAFLLSACAASAAQPPPPLQSFERLKTSLATVTAFDARLPNDVSRLNARLARDDVPGIRRASVALRRDARALERATGRVAYRVRGLVAAENQKVVHLYLLTVQRILVKQWWEARRLVLASSVVWHDPLLLDSRKAAYLWSLNLLARRSALRAVALARYAAWVKRQNERKFRYVSVPAH